MSDWMPRWPKRNVRDQLAVSGLDDDIQFNKVPNRHARGSLNQSAPAVLAEKPKLYPSGRAEKFHPYSESDSDEEYHESSDEFVDFIRPKQSTPCVASKSDGAQKAGNFKFRPEAKEWYPEQSNNKVRVPCKDQPMRIVHGDHNPIPVSQGNGYTPQRVGYNRFPARSFGRKQCDPDKFDGEKTDWTDYLKHFETVSEWNGWSYREKGMQLAMSLRGQAQRVLGDISFYGNVEDFDSLVKELTRRFSPVERETSYRLEFRNRFRNPQESVMQYGYALRRLASKAFPSIPNDCQEQWVLDQFVMGLKNHELKRHVQFGHPKSLNEAIALALEYESFEGGDSKFRPKPAKCNSIETTNDHVGTDKILRELCSVVQNSTKELQSIKKVVQNPHKGVGKSQDAHSVKGKGQIKSSSGKVDLSTVQCYKCKEFGHYQKYCQNTRTYQGQSKAENKTKLN